MYHAVAAFGLSNIVTNNFVTLCFYLFIFIFIFIFIYLFIYLYFYCHVYVHTVHTPSGVIAITISIFNYISWKKIWDNALDYGIKGTKCTQTVLRELCRPCFGECLCHLCGCKIACFSSHLFNCHPSLACNKSLMEAVSLISSVDMHFIITIGSKLGCAVT